VFVPHDRCLAKSDANGVGEPFVEESIAGAGTAQRRNP